MPMYYLFRMMNCSMYIYIYVCMIIIIVIIINIIIIHFIILHSHSLLRAEPMRRAKAFSWARQALRFEVFLQTLGTIVAGPE